MIIAICLKFKLTIFQDVKRIMKLIPKKVFFTSGVGVHSEHLESFEVALRDAGIERFNLVTVSSILPPKCEVVSKEEGLKELSPGEIIFCVMSKISSNKPGQMLSASVGCAFPGSTNKHGYISEYYACGETAEEAGKYTEELARNMYITWANEEPGRVFSIPRSSCTKENGNWTTVISVAVFIT